MARFALLIKIRKKKKKKKRVFDKETGRYIGDTGTLGLGLTWRAVVVAAAIFTLSAALTAIAVAKLTLVTTTHSES